MTNTEPKHTISQAKHELTNGELSKFIGQRQKSFLLPLLRGEERQWFASTLIELAQRIEKMPKSYETDGQGENAVVYLHYFTGSGNWWITEKDAEGGVDQAFGKADLYGDGGELGYISITELVENNVEIDLHWTPKPLKECKA